MKNKTPRLGRWCTESGFRFIPVFTAEHNTQRFEKHVQRLGCKFRRLPSHKRVALKARRIHGWRSWT